MSWDLVDLVIGVTGTLFLVFIVVITLWPSESPASGTYLVIVESRHEEVMD